MTLVTAIKRLFKCLRCGGSLLDEYGIIKCLSCGQEYTYGQLIGQLGGQETLRRYGREHFVALGSGGGRPRQKTLAELSTVSEKIKGGKLPKDLKTLRRLWKAQRVGIGEIVKCI